MLKSHLSASLSACSAVGTAALSFTQYHAAAHYDQASQAPWFSYRDAAGHEHTVWFENAASSRAKFSAARSAQIGGVYLWMYGYEDTGIWSALSHVLPTSGPHAISTSTAVS